jgi:hypothetical protein
MLNEEFQQQIDRCRNAFGKANFTENHVALIWRELCTLPVGQFEKIIETFVRQGKKPTPADFSKAYWEIRRIEGFRHVKVDTSEPSPSKISCLDCYETGFMFLKEFDGPGMFLMKCHCYIGSDTVTNWIPQWEKQLTGVFDRIQFPVTAFNPRIENSDSILGNADFWNKVENWRAKIKFSEEYWKHQRDESRGAG